MKEEMVYVVFGEAGEYSDHSHWFVCACRDEVCAREEVDRLTAWVRGEIKAAEARWDQGNIHSSVRRAFTDEDGNRITPPGDEHFGGYYNERSVTYSVVPMPVRRCAFIEEVQT